MPCGFYYFFNPKHILLKSQMALKAILSEHIEKELQPTHLKEIQKKCKDREETNV